MIDATQINIVCVILSAHGIWRALHRFDNREQYFSYWGVNPFALKRDAIEGVYRAIFALLAIAFACLQLAPQMFANVIPTRSHDESSYLGLALWFVVAGYPLGVFILSFGTWIARRHWVPMALDESAEVFGRLQVFARNGGVWPEHVDEEPQWRDDERARQREQSLNQAEGQVESQEKLLELVGRGSVFDRIDRLGRVREAMRQRWWLAPLADPRANI